MTTDRKIESSLEDFFRQDGWHIQVAPSTGDRIASCDDAELNLTECAKCVARDMAA